MNELGASLAAIDKLSGAYKVELSGKKDHELPLFNFSSIQAATDHFSDANKLGQGGFGPVFKVIYLSPLLFSPEQFICIS